MPAAAGGRAASATDAISGGFTGARRTGSLLVAVDARGLEASVFERVAMPAMTLEQGAGLHRQHVVVHIPDDPGARGQDDLVRADAAGDGAADPNLLGIDLAADRRVLADGQRLDVDVALDGAFDVELSAALEVAVDDHLGADDRRHGIRAVALSYGGEPLSGFCEHWRLPSKS